MKQSFSFNNKYRIVNNLCKYTRRKIVFIIFTLRYRRMFNHKYALRFVVTIDRTTINKQTDDEVTTFSSVCQVLLLEDTTHV